MTSQLCEATQKLTVIADRDKDRRKKQRNEMWKRIGKVEGLQGFMRSLSAAGLTFHKTRPVIFEDEYPTYKWRGKIKIHGCEIGISVLDIPKKRLRR